MTSWPDPFWERRDRLAARARFLRRCTIGVGGLAIVVLGALLVAATAGGSL